MKMKMKKGIVIGGVIATLVIGSCVTLKTMKSIPSGNTGVVVKFGAVQDEYLTSGLHFVNPIGTKVVKVNNQIKRTDIELTSASKDLQTVTGSISVNYILNADSSVSMYKTVGLDYESVVIRPAIQETAKAVISKYTAEELITKRGEVSLQMQDALAEKLNGYGLIIKEYNILTLDFSEEFNNAIEAKQTAQQQALKAKQDLERIKVESEQKVTQAQAEAEAYRLKSQEITQDMIQMEFIEKWDGHLPTVSNSEGMILDISSLTK